MPTLTNPRHEAYARARATGGSKSAAYKEVGYAASSNTGRVETIKGVPERIAELRDHVHWGETSDVAPVINELMRLAREAGAFKTAAGMVAAKGLLAEAARLKGRLAEPITGERIASKRNPPLSNAEWLAKHAPSR